MLPIDILLTFIIAACTLGLSPGPSNLYIMACTMGSGSRGGLAAASGMAIGSVIYSIFTSLGVAAVIALSPLLFVLIKTAGAVYLLYLGIVTLKDARGANLQKSVRRSAVTIWQQSILVELTNPKTMLFFLAFLPQFTVQEHGSVGCNCYYLA